MGLTIEGFNIAIENKGSLTITNSTFNNNRVDYKFKSDYGGAIVNNGVLNVLNCTFTGNYAKYGGAIYNTGTSKVIMSVFSDNTGYSSVPNLKTKIDIYNNDVPLKTLSYSAILITTMKNILWLPGERICLKAVL